MTLWHAVLVAMVVIEVGIAAHALVRNLSISTHRTVTSLVVAVLGAAAYLIAFW